MEVVTLLMDLVGGKDAPTRMAALTCLFRDGHQNTALFTEDQLQRVAVTVVGATKSGAIASFERLATPLVAQRSDEFLRSRESLRHPSLERWDGYVASDVRPFFHGGGIVFPAARRDGTLFIAVFDPFSAHALLDCVSDTFE